MTSSWWILQCRGMWSLAWEKLRHIRLYDIDDFHVDARNEQVIENLKKAEAILEEQRKEFDSWYEWRDMCRGSRS